MKIYFLSSSRIKGKVPADQILPSHSRTNEYPDGAATVILSRVSQQKPDFKIYFNGLKNGHASSQRVVAHQIFKVDRYNTYFGQNSWTPMDKLEEMKDMILKIEKIIND